VVFNGTSQGGVSLSHLTSYKLITSNPTLIMPEFFNNKKNSPKNDNKHKMGILGNI
jgi:hypothetical protein